MKLGKISTPPKRHLHHVQSNLVADPAQLNEGGSFQRLRSLKSERQQASGQEIRNGSNNPRGNGSYAQQQPVIEVEQLYVQPRKKIYLNELPRSSPSKNKRGTAALDELIMN